MMGKGHRYRLELLQKIVAAKTERGLDTTEFSGFLFALTESNSMRIVICINLYCRRTISGN